MKEKLLLVMILGASALSAMARMDGEFLHNVTSEFVTPHLEWATELEGGAINAFFITPRKYGAREVVELAQRMELEADTFVAADFAHLAVDSTYEASVLGTSAYEKTAELLKKVRPRHDVIVLANVRFEALPPEAQYRILKQVSDGTGLVIVYPGNFPFSKVLDHPTADWKQVVRMVGMDALPGLPDDLRWEDLVKTYQFGKGRIGVLNYPGVERQLGLTSYEAYAPVGWKARYENSLVLAGRLIQWASGRDVTAGFHPTVQGDVLRIPTGEVPGRTIFLRIRDTANRIVWEKQIPATGEGTREFDLSGLPAGTFYLDVRWGADGKIASFGILPFERPFAGGKLTVTSREPSHEQGAPVTVDVQMDKPLAEDAQVIVRLRDLPYRNLWRQQSVNLPKGSTKASVTFENARIPTIAALIEMELQTDGEVRARGWTTTFFPRRGIEMFPTILWANIPSRLSPMYAAQLDRSVYDAAALSHPGDHGAGAVRSALFNQRFIPYMTRIGLSAGEHGETRSGRFLGISKEEVSAAVGEEGSFNDPAVRALWKKSIERRIEGLPPLGPMIYTLGDENYFSYEAGYSPADNAAFPSFLKDLYGSIQTLNKAWGTSFESFEAVGHPDIKTMRNEHLYPAWYAHRRFVEKQYADIHHFLAQEIKKIDPHALVGAEGSRPGNIEETVQGLDFWGPYNHLIGDELLRAVAPDKLRTLWWGYGGEFLAYPLWAPLLKGTVNGNAWYSSSIEAPSGLMSVDFSLAEYYKNERKPFVDALNRGTAQTLIATPLKSDGIAILWSHASYSASFMDERFFNPKDSAAVLLKYLYRTGLNFDFLTSAMVEKGLLKNYKILWLPGATALSGQEQDAIMGFVRAGGVVVADINPGVLNASCGRLGKSGLATLFATPNLKGRQDLQMKPVTIDADIRGQHIQFDAAKAYQSPEVPVFSVNEYGKGLAILLNFNLSSAANTTEDSMDDLLASLFSLAGVAPDIHVSGISTDNLVLRVRQNEDGKILGLLADRQDIGGTATIALPETAWVYAVDQGFVGHAKEINVKLNVPFKVFSLFSSEQNAPTFAPAKTSVSAGGRIPLNLSRLSKNGIYRLEVTGPDGSVIRRFTRVFPGAEADGFAPLHFALSDPSGSYRITLTDVRTGLSSQATVTIDPAGD